MKRFISLLLALILTVSMAAMASGCKKGSSGSVDTALLKDQTIKIASWGTAEPTKGTEVGDLKWEAIEAAEEKYGCKVEFVTISDIFSQLVTAATTGQVVADVIMNRSHYVMNLMMKGDYYWSMEELGFDPTNEIYNTDTTRYTTYNGKTYGFWYDPTNVNSIMVVNKTIMGHSGLDIKDYYALVEDKKWNFDAWKKIMTACTNPDTGIYGSGRHQSSTQTLLHANETGLYTEIDGVHKENTSDTRLTEVLEFLAECTTKDKIYLANDGKAWDFAQQEFINGKYATCHVGLYVAKDYLPEQMSDEWGILPIPMGPSATDYANLDAECKTFCIQKAVEKEYAQALIQFMNETFVYPIDITEGIEGYYKSFCPDKESLENLMLIQQLPLTLVTEFTSPDLRSYDTANIMGDLGGMSTGSKPIRSTLDSMAPAIQAMLDEYYGQTSAE